MANAKISDLADGGAVGPTDDIPVARGGVNCRVRAMNNVLADGKIFVGNAGNVATAVSLGGDATVNNTGSLTLANTAVSAGTYGSASSVSQVTVDSKGRVTNAANVAISGFVSTTLNSANILVGNAGNVAVQAAMSGDVTISNSGVTTIGANKVTGAMEATLVAANAPNSDFDLTNGGAGGAVTIISQSVAGIAAGDQIVLEAACTILNNSGGTKFYTPLAKIGTLSASQAEASNTNFSGTNRSPRFFRAVFSVSASNLTYVQFLEFGSISVIASGSGTPLVLNTCEFSWASSTSDFTGTQTIALTVASSATNTTQTLTLHGWTIRKISTK